MAIVGLYIWELSSTSCTKLRNHGAKVFIHAIHSFKIFKKKISLKKREAGKRCSYLREDSQHGHQVMDGMITQPHGAVIWYLKHIHLGSVNLGKDCRENFATKLDPFKRLVTQAVKILVHLQL